MRGVSFYLHPLMVYSDPVAYLKCHCPHTGLRMLWRVRHGSTQLPVIIQEHGILGLLIQVHFTPVLFLLRFILNPLCFSFRLLVHSCSRFSSLPLFLQIHSHNEAQSFHASCDHTSRFWTGSPQVSS